jgi:hypothetical protein
MVRELTVKMASEDGIAVTITIWRSKKVKMSLKQYLG